MFKKMLLAGVVALSVSSVAYADAFYMGVGGGGKGLHDKITAPNQSLDMGNLGFTGGVYAGYLFNLPDSFNLGVELFGNGSTAKANTSLADLDGDSTDTASANVKSRYNYGVRILPAYMLTKTADMHLVLGYIRNDVRFNAGDTDDGIVTKIIRPSGFQVGVGGTVNVTREVTFRGDLLYNGYQDISVSGVNNDVNELDAVISIAYKFA